jgi:hypothetical protein
MRIFRSRFCTTVREPIWVGDLETDPKNPFFYHLTPDFECFFATY